MSVAFAEAPIVAVQNVTRAFRDASGATFRALENISLELRRGEILALLGPSGCGKSTLLNMISGLQPSDGGLISVEGRPVSTRDIPTLGYVFQEDRLFPWRTALRNVTFSLEASSMSRAERERRARKILDLMDLTAFAGSYPHQLSGGMRSRVALARSLVLEPSILLMDEPFGRLDSATRAQMHTELLRLKELLVMSIIMVTHDVDEAATLADRVIVLEPRPGRIKRVVEIPLARPRVGKPEFAGIITELKALVQ
jgi:ABC-type nitrate/sulfonate/bicarbonate transport system ATPase subunit